MLRQIPTQENYYIHDIDSSYETCQNDELLDTTIKKEQYDKITIEKEKQNPIFINTCESVRTSLLPSLESSSRSSYHIFAGNRTIPDLFLSLSLSIFFIALLFIIMYIISRFSKY